MSRTWRLIAVVLAGWAASAEAQPPVSPGGVRGIDPATNQLVAGDETRVRQAFRNMELIAKSEGADLRDAVRLVAYVTDMHRYRPIVNKIQEELWGQEVEGTFYAPPKR